MTVRHEILGGKVQLFQRPKSPFWYCSASIGSNQFKRSTKLDSLSLAKQFAEDWYLDLKGKDRWGGGLSRGKTFRKAAEKFLEEFEALTNGERSPKYVGTLRGKIDKHLNPFFGDRPVAEITESTVMEYRVERAKAKIKTKGEDGEDAWKSPARTTIHHEIITLRHVLKTAKRHGWLDHLPDLSPPSLTMSKSAARRDHRPLPFGNGWMGEEMVRPGPRDLIFGRTQRALFNQVLDELKLKKDRDGQQRTSYSLRHTYICMRLMEGADIYQIAKNCRTSVEMIEKYYASHIKNMLDTAAINVRKAKAANSNALGTLTAEEEEAVA